MRNGLIMIAALVSATAPSSSPTPKKTIRITVSDEKASPVRARVWISRSGGHWSPFADTTADGLLVREFSCAEGIMFRARPASSRYYQSNDEFCATDIKLLVAAKPNPSLVQNNHRNPMVGGAEMYPTKTILANAVDSRDHTTLVAAVKAAGLVDTLSGPGPFTVFAPTNAAFSKLPAGTVDTLVKPENKATLTAVLTYHVVPGRYTSADLAALIKKGGGRAELETVQGEPLIFIRKGSKLQVNDARGGHALVTIPDIMQSNGVIFVIDSVLMP